MKPTLKYPTISPFGKFLAKTNRGHTDKVERYHTVIPSFILTQELILKESNKLNITSKEHLQK